MATNASSSYGWVSPLVSGLAGYFGSNSAANAQAAGSNNAIGTEQQLEGQLGGIYGTQMNAGNAAFSPLMSALGVNGAPDYSAFENSPGYQFAVQQGTQAINRQAAASGGAYSSTTLGDIGQYVTGLASQNYQNYVNNLMGLAGFGSSANANYANALSNAAGNVAQAQQNKGNAYATGTAGGANAIAGAAGSLPWGNIISGIGSLFNNSGVSSGSGLDGSSMSDQVNADYANYSPPTVDPSTLSNPYDVSSINTGYDPYSGF